MDILFTELGKKLNEFIQRTNKERFIRTLLKEHDNLVKLNEKLYELDIKLPLLQGSIQRCKLDIDAAIDYLYNDEE